MSGDRKRASHLPPAEREMREDRAVFVVDAPAAPPATVPLHPRPDADPHVELNVIGSRMRKLDGLEKSTGRARYTDDLALPEMLHGKILRSPHPHARILSIDTSGAEALEGVHGVVTGAEMPEPYGIIPWTPDEQALCTDRVRYIGDGVAAVAAVDEETANRAIELIRVEYELLPAILGPEAALTEEAAATPIHEPKSGPASHTPKERSSGGTEPKARNGNIKIVKLEFGEVEQSLAESDVVVEGEGPLHPSIPAIANAIYDAVGVRMDALPFSPPRVWRALQEKAALGEAAERVAAD